MEITGSFSSKVFLNELVGDDSKIQTEDRDAIAITEEYNRVYKDVNDPQLNDKETGKSLKVLNSAGYEDIAI